MVCRQQQIFAEEDTTESDPREVDAASHNLTFIGMEGNIGCLGEGLSPLLASNRLLGWVVDVNSTLLNYRHKPLPTVR